MPAMVPDTSPPPPRMPLIPHGLSPRDLHRGLTLTPKSRGVRKPGGHATFKYTEHGACPGSVLPRYVCGVDPCPCFLGTPMRPGGGLGGRSGAWLGKGWHVEGLLGTRGGSWDSPACLGARSVCLGTSSGPGKVSVCKGVAVVIADPPANPGSGLGASPAHRGTGRLPEGDFGMFSLEARVAHKGKAGAVMSRAVCVGRQGTCAADGSGINRVATARLVWLSVPCRHTCQPALAFPSSQGASQTPLHILPAMFWLHHSCRFPHLQDHTGTGTGGMEASCAQNHAGHL